MPRLQPISGKAFARILLKLGFLHVRTRGSHHFFEHPITHVKTIVPIHSNEELDRGTLRSILRAIDLSVDEYLRIR